MKRLSIFIAFIGLSLTASAQLKVDSLGKVYIQKDADSKRVSLSVGNNPNSDLEDNYGIDSKFGLNIQTYDSGQNDYCIGILSEANMPRTDGFSIGVWGQGTGTQNNNFGVLGTINPYQNGAGICGTTEGGYPPPFQGYYAAYFYGDTFVDGSFTTYDFYNLSDIRLKTNIMPLEKMGTRQDRTLDKIQNINVISYNLKRPAKGKKVSERRAKYDEKRHFGVSAQELREIFPDLVQEGQDGYLAVSYTEMVPLLLQSIKELKQEVDSLKAFPNDKSLMSRASLISSMPETPLTTDLDKSTFSTSKGSLSQNTPNPFSERTTIRFTLPDDARKAYIYIFDMAGKMLRQMPVDSTMQSVTINGYELSPGMYIYSLVVNGQEMDTKKMILSKK